MLLDWVRACFDISIDGSILIDTNDSLCNILLSVGVVIQYTRPRVGEPWIRSADITANAANVIGFGHALATDSGVLMVGAPGKAGVPGKVLVFPVGGDFGSPQYTIVSPVPSIEYFGFAIGLSQQVAFIGTMSSGTAEWWLHLYLLSILCFTTKFFYRCRRHRVPIPAGEWRVAVCLCVQGIGQRRFRDRSAPVWVLALCGRPEP